MTEASDALERVRQQAGELYLANHLEKHALESAALEGQRRAHAEKHETEKQALDTALDADRHRLNDHRIAHEAAHAAHEKLHEAFADAHTQQHKSEADAVFNAQKAMDKRLDGMNEFRDQLRDQAATFIRRDTLETFIAQYEKAHDEVLRLVAQEREERREQQNLSAGQQKGVTMSTGIIVGAIGLFATIIGIVVVLANFLTATP